MLGEKNYGFFRMEENNMKEEKSLFVQTFGDTPYIRVIDFLMENDISDFSLQDICDHLGLARNTVSKVIETMLAMDIVKYTREVGRAKMIRINRENEVVQQLIELDFKLSKHYADKVLKARTREKEYA